MVMRSPAVLLFLALLSPSATRAEEAHYMVLFGAQSRLIAKPRAHCFVTFVKVVDPAGDQGGPVSAQIDTISWYPNGERCRLFRAPEPGRNADLGATIDRCSHARMRVYRWGPYQIEPELYERALAQKCRLDEGRVLWQAIDKRNRRTGVAINCVHAVSDIDESRGHLLFGLASGKWASGRIACHLEPWIVDPGETKEWVLDLLDLRGCSIESCPLAPAALRYGPVIP